MLGGVIVLWAFLVIVAILLAAIAIAVALSWVIGMVTAFIQHSRSKPDFREHGRDE